MSINLDEARAARREVDAVAPVIVFGGREYVLPIELPVEVVRSLTELADLSGKKDVDGNEITKVLLDTVRGFLGDQYDDFMQNSPSVNDLSAFVEGIPSEYGLGLGESQDSDAPSKITTARAKQATKKATA